MKLYRLFMVSITAALLMGCQRGADRCLAYLEDFRSGQFERFYREAGEGLKSNVPMAQMKAEWEDVLEKARDYRGSQSAVSEVMDGKTQIQVTSVHSRYQVLATFLWEDSASVSNLTFSLSPLTVEPQSTKLWKEIPVTLGYDPQKKLNGMLTLPKNVENPPVVILVQGSGPNGMDSLIGAADNRPFADLAQGLALRGIASIRYDKRSYAYPEDVTDVRSEYLYDVQDAVRFVSSDSRVDGRRIYLIGHSQGGMLSPKLALDNPEIKGIVSLGGTLRRIEDVMLYQHETMTAQNQTMSGQEKRDYMTGVERDVERIRGLTAESADNREEVILGYPVSYWISLNEIDQEEIARNLSIPMLILQGDHDFQVLYETDFKLWQEVLNGKEHVTFRHYPGLSHVFMPGSREFFDGSSYDSPAKMDETVIEDIAQWIFLEDT